MLIAALALVAAVASAATGAIAGEGLEPETLEPRAMARAQTIQAQLAARYRILPGRRGLGVTEATSTDVVEYVTLLTPDLLEARLFPADNGIWYAICRRRATCRYPAARFARPAADLVPRRLALELAIRTFLETSADVVAVSLPTPRFIRIHRRAKRPRARGRPSDIGEGARRQPCPRPLYVTTRGRRPGDPASGLRVLRARANVQRTATVDWRASLADLTLTG
jgi:hypothetical protein